MRAHIADLYRNVKRMKIDNPGRCRKPNDIRESLFIRKPDKRYESTYK